MTGSDTPTSDYKGGGEFSFIPWRWCHISRPQEQEHEEQRYAQEAYEKLCITETKMTVERSVSK